jgi:hypothetical protein
VGGGLILQVKIGGGVNFTTNSLVKIFLKLFVHSHIGAWVLKESIIHRLLVFERKILRKIFEPTKEKNGNWRIKTNKELDELIKYRNVINCVKAQRLSWFGHTNRMPETSIVKKIYTSGNHSQDDQ